MLGTGDYQAIVVLLMCYTTIKQQYLKRQKRRINEKPALNGVKSWITAARAQGLTQPIVESWSYMISQISKFLLVFFLSVPHVGEELLTPIIQREKTPNLPYCMLRGDT
ncbi:hypothetical protein OYC64_009902 [Pagothenia borchgrevinki]|uniref:Transposase n=1 Tax=Pagothenia borchgrevinki TaxID=8213 RepID=A0ABD2H6R0_PAGBO